jgi:hypothetical protein
LVGISQGNRTLGTSGGRMQDNSKMDFRKTGFENIYWIQLAQDMNQWRVFVSTIINFLDPTRDFYTLYQGIKFS